MKVSSDGKEGKGDESGIVKKCKRTVTRVRRVRDRSK